MLNNYSAKKTVNGVDYYDYTSPELKIPTWYGIDVYAGLENLSGNRFDPSETNGQTSYFGVNIPLVKNLVIDKRRAFLRQAKIYKTMSAIEQRATINDLLLDAMEAYWLWVKAYQTFKIVENNVKINEKRLNFVKMSFINGERPAIDTVEAATQLQTFQLQQNEQYLAFQNAGLQLSAFLWKSNNTPYELPENVVPKSDWEDETRLVNFNVSLPNLLAVADQNHPDLEIYKYKLDVLAIDKKLKFQELLPKVDFRYNQLGKGYNLLKTATTGPLFENNFQYGLKFEMPLFLSQGRGAYQQAKLKIEETQLSQVQKRQQIEIKVKSYYNEYTTLKAQIVLQTNAYDNYQKLVKAEETRFANGESSLFLINSRENKALEALEKLISLKTKYYKSLYALQWSAGLLR
ncbi:MAG: hypothetical protein RLZZ292_2173, partial [Bacteroidota bacterium]|jgi:outer membrane protein TolC